MSQKDKVEFANGAILPKSQIMPDSASILAPNEVKNMNMPKQPENQLGQRGAVLPQNASPPPQPPVSTPSGGKPQTGVILPSNPPPPPPPPSGK